MIRCCISASWLAVGAMDYRKPWKLIVGFCFAEFIAKFMSIHRKNLSGVSWQHAFQLQPVFSLPCHGAFVRIGLGKPKGAENKSAESRVQWVCWGVGLCYIRLCAFGHWTRPTDNAFVHCYWTWSVQWISSLQAFGETSHFNLGQSLREGLLWYVQFFLLPPIYNTFH
jgi:hypothetical protein